MDLPHNTGGYCAANDFTVQHQRLLDSNWICRLAAFHAGLMAGCGYLSYPRLRMCRHMLAEPDAFDFFNESCTLQIQQLSGELLVTVGFSEALHNQFPLHVRDDVLETNAPSGISINGTKFSESRF